MPPPVLHIIEPTLRDQTGHCHSFIGSLLAANQGGRLSLELWAGRGAETLFAPSATFCLHPKFIQPLRKLQAFFLFRRLLRTPDRLLLSTATRTELMLLDWAAPGEIPPDKVFLYFHWIRLSPRKRCFMEKIARRQPNLQVMAPSPDILARLEECGFRNARVVPYPVSAPAPASAVPAPFSALLFAGAARADKGFALVVDLVEFLHRAGKSIPVVIQASPPHNGKFEPAVQAALQRLDAIGYPHLQKIERTLNMDEYRTLFRGAISIQPYDRAEFASDRVSGITLDSFLGGSPIVVTSDTLMARMAERFGAGLAVETLSAETLWAAAEKIMAEYATFQAGAQRGGAALQRENSAVHLLGILAG